jgi:hypothetical protein
MKGLRIAAAMIFLGCSPAFAQVGMTTSPTPGLEATSPLGMSPGAPVAQTGIPLGATELASPGLSAAATGPAGMIGGTGMAGYGTSCPATAGASSGISNTSTYDGGGMGTAAGMSLPGSAAVCGAGVSSNPSSMAATPSLSPSGVSRSGIPLGSVEIGSAGVSPFLVVPPPSPSPFATTMGSLGPTPLTSATPAAPLGTPATTTTPTGINSLAPNQNAMPCGSIITSGPAAFC